MSGKENGESLTSHLIGRKEDLIQAKRTTRTVDGRDIGIIYHQGVFYAMDQHCYREHVAVWVQSQSHKNRRNSLTYSQAVRHENVPKLNVTFSSERFIKNTRRWRQTVSDAGGPLLNGDIEEFNNKLCIVCPKHKYKISLAEGEGIYNATNPKEKVPTTRWYSKGIKQRVHKITEVDGDIYVTLSQFPGWIESDYYQGEKGREQLKRELAEDDALKDPCS